MAPQLISIKSYAEAILAGERKVTLRSDLGDQLLERREKACRNTKVLDDARRLLKEMNKKPAASGSKKAKVEPKVEPKKSMRGMKKA